MSRETTSLPDILRAEVDSCQAMLEAHSIKRTYVFAAGIDGDTVMHRSSASERWTVAEGLAIAETLEDEARRIRRFALSHLK